MVKKVASDPSINLRGCQRAVVLGSNTAIYLDKFYYER